MSAIIILHIDAFADRPFSGNPAAVCFLDEAASGPWMQAVAAEMNLSETAFVHPRDRCFGLRWFTPTAEVDLCGHATLAAAHALWTEGVVDPDASIRFDTKSGALVCAREAGSIELDFPATAATAAEPPAGLIEALGAEPIFVGRSKFDILVELESESAVRALRPDFAALGELPSRGVIVTSVSEDRRHDFVSRFFAPAAGIDEDPVTGSAHCCLGPFWSARLGKSALTGYQASSRGGVVRVRVADDRVFLNGNAVTVVRGTLAGEVRGVS